MADGTHIEWSDATWNPVTGCSIVSPGCTNCYAMKLAGTRLQHHWSRKGLTRDSKAGPVWTGEVRFNAGWLTQPLSWKRPRKVFVCAHGDLFAEGVPDEWIDQVFAVMALAPQHQFQVLTKRPERMRAYLTRARGNGKQDVRNHLLWVVVPQVMGQWHPAWGSESTDGPHRSRAIMAFTRWPLPNVWLGTSIEDQKRADERVPQLLATPAAVRFVSVEPLLGPVDLTRIHESGESTGGGDWHSWESALNGKRFDIWSDGDIDGMPKLDWVIVGGESGDGARPMHPDWARALRDQCAAAGVPFFFKQWGNWTPGENVDRGHGVVETSHWFGGSWLKDKEDLARDDGHVDHQPDLYCVGKKAAGRLLDGVEHNGMPGGAA